MAMLNNQMIISYENILLIRVAPAHYVYDNHKGWQFAMLPWHVADFFLTYPPNVPGSNPDIHHTYLNTPEIW